jgi:hypothetical protein
MSEDRYTIELLSSVQAINENRKEWADFLDNHAKEHVFWQHPDFIPTNFEYSSHDTLLILVIKLGTTIQCIAPCAVCKEKFTFKFSIFNLAGPYIKILKFLGNSCVFSPSADTDKCLEIIFSKLKELHTSFDLIKIDVLNSSSPLRLFFTSTQNRTRFFQLKESSSKIEYTWQHILAPSYDDWLATLGKSTRRLVKRRVNKLYKQYPDQIELRHITRPNEVTPFLHLLNELFPKTWQAKTFGIMQRNTQQEIRFYQKIAELHWLRSYILLIDKRPVAFFIGTQYNNGFEAIEIGYDGDYSSLGVGSALSYMVIRDLYENNKPSFLDFGFGENKYKQLICNKKTPASEAYIIQPNLWGLLVRQQIMLAKLENTIRSLLIKFHIDDYFRRLLKRKK